MNGLYKEVDGWVVGRDRVGSREVWAAGGGLYFSQGHRLEYCVFIKWQKQTQFTAQNKAVIDTLTAAWNHTPYRAVGTGQATQAKAWPILAIIARPALIIPA